MPHLTVAKKFLTSLALTATIISNISAYAAYDSTDIKNTGKLKVTSIIPSGTSVRKDRQIVINFNRKVVPLQAIPENYQPPITISPKVNCKWHWLSSTALACQLDQKDALKKATKYNITVHKNFAAEDGTKTEEAYNHSFTTLPPQYSYYSFSTWKAPSVPVIRIVFNQEVSKTSVKKHLFMTTKGSKIKRSIDVLPTTLKNTSEYDRVWLISPSKPLPLDTNATLRIEPGVVSKYGKETSNKNRKIVNFDTFPEFKFAGIKCRDTNGRKIKIRENGEDFYKCAPLKVVSLQFSSPVSNEQVKNNLIITPDLAGGRKDYDPWANTHDYDRLRSHHKKGNTYGIWLPEKLKADKKYNITTRNKKLSLKERIASVFKQLDRTEFKDEFGRSLPKDEELNFDFYTDNRAPNFVRPHNISVLEKGVNSDHLIYTTNIDKIDIKYKSLTKDGQQYNKHYSPKLPKNLKNIQFASFLGIRDMLDGKSGAIYGDIKTHIHDKRYPYEVFSQVTPYQVQAKLGHFNTVIWVTDFATGQPVSDAVVTIYPDTISKLTPNENIDLLDKGETNSNGIAILKGRQDIDPQINFYNWNCSKNNSCKNLFVKIEKDNDIALLPLFHDFEINTYNLTNRKIWDYNHKKFGHMNAWGTTPQGIYTAGEKIDYKIYVRNQNNHSLTKANSKNYTLKVTDPTGKVVLERKKIELSEFGGISGSFETNKNSAVGWYNFELSADFTDHAWYPLKVLVSDFTPSPFNVSNEINGKLFKAGQNVEVTTYARLHSGGAYTDAQARVTATLNKSHFSSDHPKAAGFHFDSANKHYKNNITIFNKTKMLNDKGELTLSFPINEESIVYGDLTIESAVRDDRGKNIASSKTAKYVAFDRFVGLKSTKWVYKEDEPAEIKYIVVDSKGNPASGTVVDIKIEQRITKSSRVKSAGNAYVTKYITEWKEVTKCEGTSTENAKNCIFTPKDAGTFKLTATIPAKLNDNNKKHSTTLIFWVAGKGRVVWEEPKDNSLQVIPEKSSYNIGDTAKYFIKNPYPGAKALVTIERYGILKHWVQTFENSTEILEFPVEKDYMPGFYLSVTVFSPRVEKPIPGIGKIDMDKPTFKMGYIKVPVKDPYKQIDVEVKTDEDVYKPRDTVKVNLTAKPKNQSVNEPIEMAVVVLDEAVLDLIQGGTVYFDPYDGFYKLKNLDISNYSLLTKLIGRQKIRKKGANTGGGGSFGSSRANKLASASVLSEMDDMSAEEANIQIRDLFKFVSYWNPSIKADANGNASFEFEVPDNLTGWRVLAIAVTPTDRLGLGQGSFKVNRKTEIRPVMPNQITEGDEFKAGFSVMNRSDEPRTMKVKITVEGEAYKGKNNSHKGQIIKTVELAPYKRTTVFMPVKTISAGGTKLKFTAKAFDNVDSDGTTHLIKVQKRRSLETVAFYGTTTKKQVTEEIKVDENLFPNVGDISVTLSPSVIANVEGAFKYMRDYKYPCWEQKLTKAVMAMHYQNLKAYMPDDFEWKGSKNITQRLLDLADNYQAPNGGMVYFIASNDNVSPYLSAYTALAFNWLRESGYKIPETVEGKLHVYLQKMLRENVSPTFYSAGMQSTVRAVALAALSKQNKIRASDIRRYEPHVKQMSLFGKSMYLQAAINAMPRLQSEPITETIDMILAQSSQTGGKFIFNEEIDNDYYRILASPLRSNCSILSVLTKYGETQTGANIVADIPFKLVRTITQTRGNRSHWENTQENMFCMNALVDYSRIYEKDKPSMKVTVNMDDRPMGKTAFTSLKDDAVTFSNPITKDDLGTTKTASINKEGTGRIYYKTQMKYALKADRERRLNAGIDVRKEYSVKRNNKWVMLQNPMEVKRGEIIKVDLFVSIPTARNFLVVDDPVPGGLEPVNKDLATASGFDVDSAAFDESGGSWWFKFGDWRSYGVSRWSFYHKELRHNAVRFYSEYLPAGNYHLSYAAQVIAEGTFVAMPVYSEEMYDPDVFGKGLTTKLHVAE
ncbi:MAG: large extracellular alpha-helical protein [Alphaproteobacteria bacterium]|nr:large extracellular alpha-helical protein [Alphaproteobacteria bacterium]